MAAEKKAPFVILGVDPGFSVTGYAILKQDETGKAFLLDYGYLKMSPKNHLSERVGEFYNCFSEKIKLYGVTQVSLETSFLGKNPQTFLKLGYLRGVLYLLANQNNLGLLEFSPREIKMSVVGFGGATKDQVAAMVLRLFPGLNKMAKIAKNDVTDALAICVCGLWQKRQDLLQKMR
ncbi:crossover junction endodeoxyribonuclease RuvC [Candidatus Dependentiae bacterium]|nr:crossover junction endodeoxyribonuclease RuvC [Candidatus Dependentiae bacterium]